MQEIKLIDVPEMGYTFSSKPYPSGEICIRGPHIARGYFSLPKETLLLINFQSHILELKVSKQMAIFILATLVEYV